VCLNWLVHFTVSASEFEIDLFVRNRAGNALFVQDDVQATDPIDTSLNLLELNEVPLYCSSCSTSSSSSSSNNKCLIIP